MPPADEPRLYQCRCPHHLGTRVVAVATSRRMMMMMTMDVVVAAAIVVDAAMRW